MRIALIADVHLDSQFGLFPPELARERRHGIEEALRRAIGVAAEEAVDAVLLAGDLYEHERVAPDTGELLRSLLAEVAPLPVFVAPGNHDWLGPESLYARLEWPSNVHVFREDRLEPVELEDGLTLWGAAHRAPANTDGFLDGFRVARGGVNVALFHGSERSRLVFEHEAKMPHAPFLGEQISEAGLSHAFCGHYHTPADAPSTPIRATPSR
jgi:DNA repair protein SbcD/Mre11